MIAASAVKSTKRTASMARISLSIMSKMGYPRENALCPIFGSKDRGQF